MERGLAIRSGFGMRTRTDDRDSYQGCGFMLPRKAVHPAHHARSREDNLGRRHDEARHHAHYGGHRRVDAAGPVRQTPPAAAKVPHITRIHGYTLTDDYFWLRQKAKPEVTQYLEAENAYTEEVMRPTKALQETLYKEMLGRIKQTDLERALPNRRVLLLLAHRGRPPVPIHVPPAGQHERARRKSCWISTSWRRATSSSASAPTP